MAQGGPATLVLVAIIAVLVAVPTALAVLALRFLDRGRYRVVRALAIALAVWGGLGWAAGCLLGLLGAGGGWDPANLFSPVTLRRALLPPTLPVLLAFLLALPAMVLGVFFLREARGGLKSVEWERALRERVKRGANE